MVSRKLLRNMEDQQREERRQAYKHLQTKSAVIIRRLSELHNGERKNIAEEVLKIFRYAKSQGTTIGRSIVDKGYRTIDCDTLPEGDAFTCMAEGFVDLVRANTCNPQTAWQALSDQFPDVHFTVDEFDAASSIAASFRTEYLAGVLEGLELAGIKIPDSDPDLD
jgi:hypothetical protein